jgi:hypothetical protein
LIVQVVLHKYSHALGQHLHDSDHIDPRELCCTDTSYAGCVPRGDASGRTYLVDPTSVGAEIADVRNLKSKKQSGWRFSFGASVTPPAAQLPFLRGT